MAKRKTKKKTTKKTPAKKKARKKRPPPKPPEVLDAEKIPLPGKPEDLATAPAIEKLVGKSSFTPPKAEESNQYIRFAAGLHYTTNMNGTSLEQMHKHPLYGKVSIHSLQAWSAQDRWVERRQENLNKWRRAIEDKLTNEIVKARADQLERMQNLFATVLNKLQTDVVEARSYEGLLSAFVKLADLIDGWTEKQAAAVIPDGPAASPGTSLMPATKPDLTNEEARDAAKLILRQRRAKVRAQLERQKAESEGKERPTLKVIRGEPRND